MGALIVRDPSGREFEIDPSARAFWEHREGHQILPAPEAGEEPAKQDNGPAQSAVIVPPVSKEPGKAEAQVNAPDVTPKTNKIIEK